MMQAFEARDLVGGAAGSMWTYAQDAKLREPERTFAGKWGDRSGEMGKSQRGERRSAFLLVPYEPRWSPRISCCIHRLLC